MLLTAAQVKMFKSIDDSGNVSIDPYVTVLVGQNEAGKTAFYKRFTKQTLLKKAFHMTLSKITHVRRSLSIRNNTKNLLRKLSNSLTYSRTTSAKALRRNMAQSFQKTLFSRFQPNTTGAPP